LHKSIDPESQTSSPSMVSTTSTSIARMVKQSLDGLGLFGERMTEEEEAAEEKIINAMQKLNMEMFDEELRVSLSILILSHSTPQDLEAQSKVNLILITTVIAIGVVIMIPVCVFSSSSPFPSPTDPP
jgi:hypothetical protein